SSGPCLMVILPASLSIFFTSPCERLSSARTGVPPASVPMTTREAMSLRSILLGSCCSRGRSSAVCRFRGGLLHRDRAEHAGFDVTRDEAGEIEITGDGEMPE